MKIIVFIVGLVLSIWVGMTIHWPAETFVTGIKKVYLQSKTITTTLPEKSAGFVNVVANGYEYIARVFGVEVATENAKKEIMTTLPIGSKDAIENLFNYDLPFWISVFAGFMTLSIYLNIVWIIAFFLKPITFFMK